MKALMSAAVLAVLAGEAAAQVTVLPLPVHPAYGQMIPRAISGDGRVVVGYGDGHSVGMVWTIDGELETIPANFPTGGTSVINGTNYDGSVVVGAAIPGTQTAFRWVRGSTFTLLTGQNGSPLMSSASGVTDDGGLVIGECRVSGNRGLTWTAATGTVRVPGIPGGANTLFCSEVSADGGVIVGALTGSLSFMWTAEGGTIYVPTLPGLSHATSSRVTRSGDLVLGTAFDAPGTAESYTWTPDTGAYILPRIEGYFGTSLRTISGDGRVIAGRAVEEPLQTDVDTRAVIWTLGEGTEFLAEYLNRLGSSYSIADFHEVVDLSEDGMRIVGKGGIYPYWVAIIPPPQIADFNLDRFVDFLDLTDFIECWSGETRLPLSTADLNHDGFTDFFDLIEYLDRFDGGG